MPGNHVLHKLDFWTFSCGHTVRCRTIEARPSTTSGALDTLWQSSRGRSQEPQEHPSHLCTPVQRRSFLFSGDLKHTAPPPKKENTPQFVDACWSISNRRTHLSLPPNKSHVVSAPGTSRCRAIGTARGACANQWKTGDQGVSGLLSQKSSGCEILCDSFDIYIYIHTYKVIHIYILIL